MGCHSVSADNHHRSAMCQAKRRDAQSPRHRDRRRYQWPLFNRYTHICPAKIKAVLTNAVDHDYRRLKFEEDVYMPNMTSLDDRDVVRHRWDELLPRKLTLDDWSER